MGGSEVRTLLEYCRSLPGATEDVKWENNRVFSVGGKMFASFNLPDGEPFGFKTDPHVFADLTQREGIEPAAYLARALWVSLRSSDLLPIEEIQDLLYEAHAIVAAKLPRTIRSELGIDQL